MKPRELNLMRLFLAVLVLRGFSRGEAIDRRLRAIQAINMINRTLDQTFSPRESAQAASFAYQHIEKEMEQLL